MPTKNVACLYIDYNAVNQMPMHAQTCRLRNEAPCVIESYHACSPRSELTINSMQDDKILCVGLEQQVVIVYMSICLEMRDHAMIWYHAMGLVMILFATNKRLTYS